MESLGYHFVWQARSTTFSGLTETLIQHKLVQMWWVWSVYTCYVDPPATMHAIPCIAHANQWVWHRKVHASQWAWHRKHMTIITSILEVLWTKCTCFFSCPLQLAICLCKHVFFFKDYYWCNETVWSLCAPVSLTPNQEILNLAHTVQIFITWGH